MIPAQFNTVNYFVDGKANVKQHKYGSLISIEGTIDKGGKWITKKNILNQQFVGSMIIVVGLNFFNMSGFKLEVIIVMFFLFVFIYAIGPITGWFEIRDL